MTSVTFFAHYGDVRIYPVQWDYLYNPADVEKDKQESSQTTSTIQKYSRKNAIRAWALS